MSDYFDPLAVTIAAGTRALAAQVNAVTNLTSAAFDKLPTETEFKLGLTRYAVDTGVADAYIVTLPYVPTLTDGFNLTFKASNANTGASTITVNGLTTKSIKNSDGTDLVASALPLNAIVVIAFESVADAFILISQNPAQAAQAAASAAAAAASAAAALTSEGNAATSESNAATSESNASTSAGNASTSETNAAASETAAAASFTEFDARYLGSKASDPTLDNDGLALIDGALYWNTTVNDMRVYDLGGTTWVPFTQGGDAATLDGLDSTQFLRSDVDDTFTGVLTVTGQADIDQLRLNGNLISSITGDITLTAAAGSGVIVEGVLFDGGAITSVLSLTATNTGTVLFDINHNGGAGSSIDLDHAGSSDAVNINSTGGNALAVNANAAGNKGIELSSTVASRTVDLLQIINSNATGTGNAVTISQAQGGFGLDISHTGTNGVGLNVVGNNASRTNDVAFIHQANASSIAIALQVQQDGNSTGLLVDANGTGAGTALAVNNEGTGTGLSVTQNGVAEAMLVTQNAAEDGIFSQHNNATGSAISAFSNTASRTDPLVEIINTNATGSGIAASISNDQSGDALNVVNTNAAGVAGHFSSNVASRTVPVVEIINDNATGSGKAMVIQQDQSAEHIQLLGANGLGIDMIGGILLAERASGAFGAIAAGRGEIYLDLSTSGGTPVLIDDSDDEFGMIARDFLRAVDITGASNNQFVNLPSWVRHITIVMNDISVATSTSVISIQLGDSGGYETTGYTGAVSDGVTTNDLSTSDNGFDLDSDSGGTPIGEAIMGVMHLWKMTDVLWFMEYNGARANGAQAFYGSGTKTTTGTMDRFRIISSSGNFDGNSLWSVYCQ